MRLVVGHGGLAGEADRSNLLCAMARPFASGVPPRSLPLGKGIKEDPTDTDSKNIKLAYASTTPAVGRY